MIAVVKQERNKALFFCDQGVIHCPSTQLILASRCTIIYTQSTTSKGIITRLPVIQSRAVSVIAAALLAAGSASAFAEPVENIVLIHGAFADGSGWKPVYDILSQDGYTNIIMQESETAL